jgi:hypothetical protein
MMIIEYQDYDTRELRRAPMRGEGYSDLELETKDDDFEHSIEFMPLDSFDSGSPPPETKTFKRAAERGSPTRSRSIYRYRGSPPPSYTTNHPPPAYYTGPHPYGYQPYFHPTHFPNDQPPPWSSPQIGEYERVPPPPDHSSRDKRRDESPNSDKPGRWVATPERGKSRSPFRSPTSNQGSAKVSLCLKLHVL